MTPAADVGAHYDYVVAGAGSAGCIVAAELARNGTVVLPVEDGPGDRTSDVSDSRRDFAVVGTSLVRQYGSEPSTALDGRRLPIGQGRVLAGGGSVRLASQDWRTPPRLDNGLLKTELDRKVAARGLEHLQDLADQQAMRGLTAREVLPGVGASAAERAALIRRATVTFNHPIGTCRMGSDDDAVVAPDLRVRGVDGLRVCDSSIMPVIPSCPTNAASCMIGLRASQMILSGTMQMRSVA